VSAALTVHIARQDGRAQAPNLTMLLDMAHQLLMLRPAHRRIPRRRLVHPERNGDEWMTQVLPVAVVAALQIFFNVSNAHAGVAGTVPEPGALTLVTAGAAIVALGAWWRNRK
jgi:hypothetical protein